MGEDSGLFDVYTKTVEVDGKKFTIRPLSGKYLAKLYSIIAKLDNGKGDMKDENSFMSSLDEDTLNKLYTVVFESLKKSYPNYPEEKIEEFCSQNFFSFIEVVVEVNSNVPENAERSR